jgi:hypothetical protein
MVDTWLRIHHKHLDAKQQKATLTNKNDRTQRTNERTGAQTKRANNRFRTWVLTSASSAARAAASLSNVAV